MNGLNFTAKSLPALKFDETTSWRVNTMCSANCLFEVLKTTKLKTDQTSQINSGSVLLLTGAQPIDSLLALHCFCFPGPSNLWISSGDWKVGQVIPLFTE